MLIAVLAISPLGFGESLCFLRPSRLTTEITEALGCFCAFHNTESAEPRPKSSCSHRFTTPRKFAFEALSLGERVASGASRVRGKKPPSVLPVELFASKKRLQSGFGQREVESGIGQHGDKPAIGIWTAPVIFVPLGEIGWLPQSGFGQNRLKSGIGQDSAFGPAPGQIFKSATALAISPLLV